jgi:hypothetical protein
MRIECKCGERGAALMYMKPIDPERMHRAAADGWNLAGGGAAAPVEFG